MFFRVLEKDQVPTFVEGLAQVYEVVAPVKRESGFVFEQVGDGADVVLDYPFTIVPPKKYFISPREELLRFETDASNVEETEADIHPRVILGMHACDINALLMTDRVFLGDYVDPYYKARRENTLIIGVSCMPIETCMCNTWGTGAVQHGCDLFLTDLGDRYFVMCYSVEGAQVLDTVVDTREATAAD
jgi:hypothetical protein